MLWFRKKPKLLLPFRVRWGGLFVAQIIHPKSGLPIHTENIDFNNGVTNVGIEDNESVYFGGGTQKPNWYFGIISNSGYTSLQPADTMSSHVTWNEITGYVEATRPQWGVGAPSGRLITNGTPADFALNADADIRGAFIVSDSTKGGASGILWSTGLTTTVHSLLTSQIFRLTYRLTGASS